MKEVKHDIYKNLKRNNLIVWAMTVLCASVAMYSVYMSNKAAANAERFVYGISSNEKLLPLEQIEKAEIKQILKKAHIEHFLNNFYAYDQWNYKKRIEKALWLIDESGKGLYNHYKQSGYYNRMIQTTSSQSIASSEIVIDGDGNFQASAIIAINKANQEEPKRYVLKVAGKLKQVSQNYPLNPYGYLILDFKEISKKQIKDE
ncbi:MULTISPECIES: hypothetical protein [Flavobacteriaceae]|uniref:hypothetical protein n=1 Tax=Flavobacteriaceae TaxID=49546 RepID=UPI001491A096|nr:MULTISPECIES: hypothetical protein [Allomuricauda]MDC6367204.1 hypothetical protein [Muricauda sp. AC10]